MPIELKTQDTLEYVYHPVPSRTLRFKVKAANDGHVILSEGANPGDADPVLEIFIGGWSNQKSAIRRDRAKPDKALVDTPDALSNDEFRGFWINYLGGAIAVGRENEIEPFLTWTDPAPINVGYFGVCTGYGATGEWIIDDENYDDEPLRNVVLDTPDVPGQAGVVPDNSVLGGFDNENLYVGRAQHEGAVIPGKIVSSHGVCYVAWGGAEHGKPEYEALTGSNLQWVPAVEGQIPPNAVVGGTSEDGETLYIGRAQHDGSTTVGKVQPSHGACYIPYGGQELSYPEYEILVQQ